MCRLLFRALKPLKSSLHFFQVAFFRDEVQPESCVRAFRTHTTTQATLATLMQATLATFARYSNLVRHLISM